MLLYYTVPQALQHLKYRIEYYEKRILKEKSPFKKKEYEDIIEWYFERGLTLIQYTKEIETKPELIKYFTNETHINPEHIRINNKCNKKAKKYRYPY